MTQLRQDGGLEWVVKVELVRSDGIMDIFGVRDHGISQELHKVSREREMSGMTTRFFGLENLEEGAVTDWNWAACGESRFLFPSDIQMEGLSRQSDSTSQSAGGGMGLRYK